MSPPTTPRARRGRAVRAAAGALARTLAKLVLLPAFLWPEPATLAVAAASLPLAAFGAVADRRRLVRLEHLLTAAAFLLLAVHHRALLRETGDPAAAVAAAVARAMEERVAEDARLLEGVVRAIGPELSPAGPGAAFDLLAERFRRQPLDGRGVKLLGPEDELVAWYGTTLDAAAQAARVRLPGQGAAADLVVGRNRVGLVLRAGAGPWSVVLEDPWSRGSPAEALGLPPSGWLAELERRIGVEVTFGAGGMAGARPEGADADALAAPEVVAGEEAVPGTPEDDPELQAAPVRLAGVAVARAAPRPPAEPAEGSPLLLRLAALCAVLAFALLLRSAWCEVERRRSEETRGREGGRVRAWLAALGLKASLLLAFRGLLEAGDFLQILLPGPLSAPISFGSGALGPFTSSPADLLATGLLAALLGYEAYRSAEASVKRAPGSPAEDAAAPGAGGGGARGARVRWLALALALLAAGAAGHPLLIRALAPLIRDTSTQLLFRPNLYSTPEGAFLFAGLAALAAAVVLALATLFALATPREPGTPAAGAARLWPWSAGAAVLVAVAAAFYLDRSAPRPSGPVLATALWALAVLVALSLVGARRYLAGRGHGWPGRLSAEAVLLGLFAGYCVAAGHGAGRVWALHQFAANRLEEVSQPSNQWLEYNLRRTAEGLSSRGAGGAAPAGQLEGAAFIAWTATPLRDLPVPSALLIVDHAGLIHSRFSLLPPRDAELLPEIARAALHAPAGRLGRAQTAAGRLLFFTAVPLARPDAPLHAVAIVSEVLEPALEDETAAYFLHDVFSADRADPFLFAVRRGDPMPPPGRALTLTSGSGEERLWISVPLEAFLPDALDHLSLALSALAGAFLFLFLYQWVLGSEPVRWRAAWGNPFATFRGRVFSVLLAFVAVPVAVYSWVSFQTTRHEIEQATRALAEESLRAAGAFLGPRLQAGGLAELQAILPEAARVVNQDLVVYREGVVLASNRPEIFQANLLSRRIPGELYRRLVFGGERLATQRQTVGRKEVLIAYLATPWSAGGAPYVLGSPLLLRETHFLRDQRDLLQILFVMVALSLIAMGVFSWVVSRQLSSPLAALKEGADRIARGELSHRLQDTERGDEFGRLFSAFNTMAAGLQVSQGELVAEKSKVQAILSSIGTGVVALDREGRVQLANQAARELLGLPPEVAGRRPGEVLPAAFWERAARALKLGQRREDDVQLGGANGQRTLHLISAPLMGEGGERRGLVVVFDDLSSVFASQRALAWEEMARQVAHEIKNPLTPIKLSLQHLQRLLGNPPREFRAILERSLDLVLAEIGRLERITGEFSRFGSGGRAGQPIEAEAALRRVLELYAGQDGRQRFELVVAGEPVAVLAEEDGLKKILVNLLENARQAMEQVPHERGAVRVELDYGASPRAALVRVRDQGPGIPPEDLERLFEPYFSTKTRGTGLGLAIARRIVESWGGAIEARNWDGGAEVLLWLAKSTRSSLTPTDGGASLQSPQVRRVAGLQTPSGPEGSSGT